MSRPLRYYEEPGNRMIFHTPLGPNPEQLWTLTQEGVMFAHSSNTVVTMDCDTTDGYTTRPLTGVESNTNPYSRFPAYSTRFMLEGDGAITENVIVPSIQENDVEMSDESQSEEEIIKPGGSILVFDTGKSLVTGVGKTSLSIYLGILSAKRFYDTFGTDCSLNWIKRIRINNIVIHGQFKWKLNTETLLAANPWMSRTGRYKSITCFQPNFKCTISLYGGGTFTSTGSKKIENFTETLMLVIPSVKPHFILNQPSVRNKKAELSLYKDSIKASEAVIIADLL